MTCGTRVVVVVTGGRDFGGDDEARQWLLERLGEYDPLMVLHGDAPGADQFAGTVALNAGYKVRAIRAAWDDPSVPDPGPARNARLLLAALTEYGSVRVVVLALPGYRGTANTLALARRAREQGGDLDIRQWTAKGEVRRPQETLFAPVRVCNGGPEAIEWCGKIATHVARDERGLEWFCCSDHTDGTGGPLRPGTRLLTLSTWYETVFAESEDE